MDSNAAPQLPLEGRVTEFFSRLCATPALTLMLFTRKGLGFNVVSYLTIFVLYVPLSIAGMWALLATSVLALTGVHRAWLPGFDPWLFLFAQAVLVLGVVTHVRRLRDFKGGKLWWSYSGGTPRLLDIAPGIPQKLARRVVEPVILMGFAVVVFLVLSKILGVWIFWAAFCLAVHEQLEADLELHRAIELQDAIITTNMQIAAGFRGTQRPGAPPRPAEERKQLAVSAQQFGLSTDHEAAEIRLQLERRRQRQLETKEIDYGTNVEGNHDAD